METRNWAIIRQSFRTDATFHRSSSQNINKLQPSTSSKLVHVVNMSTPIYIHAIIRYDGLSLYITVIAGLGNCTAAACMLMFLPSINSRATEHKDDQLLWVGFRPHNIATIVNSTTQNHSWTGNASHFLSSTTAHNIPE